MRKITYKAVFVKTNEKFTPSLIGFDKDGKMNSLTLYTAEGRLLKVDTDKYKIIYVYEDFSDEEVNKMVTEDKTIDKKFKIGK